jgi:hypothetical protein
MVREKNPSIPLNTNTINMSSLKNSIISNLKPFDRKYMILKDFSVRKATFVFDHKKWLKDSIYDGYSTTRLTRFARVFRLKKKVPFCIKIDSYFEKFLIRKFKNYMEDKHKEGKWFKHLFPDTARTRLRGRIRSMFNWEYDPIWNTVTATLKPLYVLAIMYATGVMVNKIRKGDLSSPYKEKLFATKVYSNLKKFDYGKFDKYSRRKGYI